MSAILIQSFQIDPSTTKPENSKTSEKPQGILKRSTLPKTESTKTNKEIQERFEEVNPTEKNKIQEIQDVPETQEMFEEVSPTE